MSELANLTVAGLKLVNPHFKYIELSQRGYLLLDVDATWVVSEWWYVDTVTSISNAQSFGMALQVQDGARHLIAAS